MLYSVEEFRARRTPVVTVRPSWGVFRRKQFNPGQSYAEDEDT
jgi:hypothetical protein